MGGFRGVLTGLFEAFSLRGGGCVLLLFHRLIHRSRGSYPQVIHRLWDPFIGGVRSVAGVVGGLVYESYPPFYRLIDEGGGIVFLKSYLLLCEETRNFPG